MELRIGQYILTQRTKYSKIRIFDIEQNKDITDTSEGLIDAIMKEYEMQKLRPDDYFEIDDDDVLIGLKDDLSDMTYVFVPEGVKILDINLFDATNFEFISLPSTLKRICENAFSDCRNLRYIYIPDSVTTLSAYTFAYCENLKYARLPDGIDIIEGDTFNSCHGLEEITIPDSVEEIGSYAFEFCNSLRTINLPKNLKTLGSCVFYQTSKLEKIELPSGLETIADECFFRCEGLKEITIPDSVEYIYPRAFLGCEALEKVVLPKNLTTLEHALFTDCYELSNIEIPDSVSKLCNHIFEDNELIENITLPKNLEIVSGMPFSGSNITSLTFKHDLKHIIYEDDFDIEPDLVFNTQISKLIIDNSVKTITPDAFYRMGRQIKEIDYLGTKEEFEEFMDNNKKLFKNCLTNFKTINFLEKSLEDKDIETIR